MQLPNYLQSKIDKLSHGLKNEDIRVVRESLTYSYKKLTGSDKSHIKSGDDSLIYAISRMPSTYVVLKSLVESLISQGSISDIKSILEFGSGTGAGYFALKEIDSNLSFRLVERDKNMVSVFKTLSDGAQNVEIADVCLKEIKGSADLILASYILSEMTEVNRNKVFLNMLSLSQKYVLLVDTGTPETYQEFLKLKFLAEDCGWNVVAPCKSNKCGLSGDYCQFFARVERSKLQMVAKSATLPYEDEKYFYLLFSKEQYENLGARVIRRPLFEKNCVKLMLCTKLGIGEKVFTKKNNNFKTAKKSKINDVIFANEEN